VCGRNDEEEEEDEGEEEERRMVFLGQLLKTSVPLLAFRETRGETRSHNISQMQNLSHIPQTEE